LNAEFSIAAATAVIGYDLMGGNSLNQARHDRFLRAAGLAGSAAALDTEVEVFVDQEKVGNIYNAATGAVTRDHMRSLGHYVPAGAQVRVMVKDAPVTNPINGVLDFDR